MDAGPVKAEIQNQASVPSVSDCDMMDIDHSAKHQEAEPLESSSLNYMQDKSMQMHS